MLIGEIIRAGRSSSSDDNVSPVEEETPVFDLVDIQNIDFDPHLHGVSDGDLLHNTVGTALELGISFGVSDHIRQVRDDVVYYKDSDQAYRNTDESGGNDFWLADNMHLLQNLIEHERQDIGKDSLNLEETTVALKESMDDSEIDEVDVEEEAKSLIEIEGQKYPRTDLVLSAEQDYEEWNEEIITEFMREQDLPYWVLSTHYIELDSWEKPRYFRHSDFEELEENQLREAVESYFDQYRNKIRFGSQKEDELDTTVIHSHMDGLLRNDHLRPYVTEDHIEDALDLAEEYDAVVEINGRIIRKLRNKYTAEDNFYAPEDAEWFAHKVLERAEDGDLDFTIASDAHSAWGMFEQYTMLDSILDEYEAEPLDYNDLLERDSTPEEQVYGERLETA